MDPTQRLLLRVFSATRKTQEGEFYVHEKVLWVEPADRRRAWMVPFVAAS